uniref:Uncharacterized protein n=1 Tax=Anguilla anguilla TaxID=7936 RepID=A0A0E9VS07_ANGAN
MQTVCVPGDPLKLYGKERSDQCIIGR